MKQDVQPPVQSSEFSFRPFSIDEHGKQVVDLITRTFVEREPMTRYLGISAEEFQFFLAAQLEKFEREGLSIVAVEASQERVVSVMLSEDGVTPPPPALDHVSESFAPILSILGELCEHYFALHPTAEPNQHAHLFMAATDVAYTGKGLARELIRRSIQRAQELGYTNVYCESTGSTSQWIVEKHGCLRKVHSIAYSGYESGGVLAFPGLLGGTEVKLMARTLPAFP